jgi:uncharacterized protein (DUF58 family)
VTESAAFLDYRVAWRAGQGRPGKHASRQAGRDGDFRRYRPFWQLPDATRIDIRRSIMDPFGGVVVRQMEQRSAITVMLALDVSRSMAPAPQRSHMSAMADLLDAAARSALRAGDAIGVLAFDTTIRAELSAAPSRQPAVLRDTADSLRAFVPAGNAAAGLCDLAAHLPQSRCLIILASDFLMPHASMEAALISLSRHDVAPVVMGGHAGTDMPPTGLVRLRDAETGARRLVFMRPALRQRTRDAAVARRLVLDQMFATHARPAFYAGPGIDLTGLSFHLTAP